MCYGVLGLGLLRGRKRDKRKRKHQTAVTRPHECHFFLHCFLKSALAVSFVLCKCECVCVSVCVCVCVCKTNSLCLNAPQYKHSLCIEEKKIAK